jgi:tRNA pseudouridine55 synthase
MPAADGILLLDKPEGLSSNAALQRVRRLLGARKAGHVGSLDPLATGMLPICLDEATKIAGDILSGRKRYRFTVTLGSRTATGDREGAVVETAPVPTLTPEDVEAALNRFRGKQQQIPPMYSALKRDGQPLYRLARAGIEVERAPREIEIFELTLLSREAAALQIDALCSKGTYVRSLAEDIARALGTCGHVTQLRRVYVEPFENEPMISLETVEQACGRGETVPLIAADRALPQLPPISLTAAAAARITQGQAVDIPGCNTLGRVRLHDPYGRFLGIAEASGTGVVQPRRLFTHPLDPAAVFSL